MLLLVERPGGVVAEEMRKADDVGERRAQLVAHMVHEIDLDLVGVFQRLVALAQRALDVDGVGDVLERHQRGAVRQRHGRAFDHAAVAPLDLAVDRRAAVDRGDGHAQRRPHRVVAGERVAPADHRLDMRALLQRGRIELPHLREHRIEQPQPPVAREHRDAFRQIVEGLALHADQRLEAPLQVERLGDVVVEVDHAAFRIGRGDDAQGAAAGQVPFVRLGLGRAIGLVQLGLPLAEVLLLRQPARVAQAVEDRGIARALIEEAGLELPEHMEGGVVEGEAAVDAEDGDAGGEIVERAAVGVDHARELGAHDVGLGRVDADAGAAAAGRNRQHVEHDAAAADDRRQPAAESLLGFVGAEQIGARGAVEQLDAARDRLAGVPGVDRARIGGVHVSELAGFVARPDRRRQRLDQGAHGVGVVDLMLEAAGELGEVALDAAHVLEAQDRAPADDLSLGLDRAAVERRQRHREFLPALAQASDRGLDRLRRPGLEPEVEGEHALRRVGVVGHQRDVADDLGLVVAGRPGHQDLRLRAQQCIDAVDLGAAGDDLVARTGFGHGQALAGAHQAGSP